MKNDPIVNEIHRYREAYAKRFNFNLDTLFSDLKAKEKRRGLTVVKRSPKILKQNPYAQAS